MNENLSPSARWPQGMADFRLAVAFLTRLPIADPGPCPPGALAGAMALFPVVGALIGAGAGAVHALAGLILPPAVAALLAVFTLILITGALHEDGWADTADGLGARGGPERRLAAMRDSRLGAFGGLALLFSVGLRAAALAAAPEAWAALGALVAAAALSRALIPAVMQVLPAARAEGLGAGAGVPHAGVAALALGLGAIAAILGLGRGAPAALLAALLAALAVTWLARRTLGGFTGDVLGAVQQGAEIAVLVVAAGQWS